jgi:integrase
MISRASQRRVDQSRSDTASASNSTPCATLTWAKLIDAGMDVITISRRLGHASPNVTLGVYGHRFKNKDGQSAQIVEAASANVGRDG